MKLTLIAALCDKLKLVSEYGEYVKFILDSVTSSINLFQLTVSERQSLLPEYTKNSLLNELVNIKDDYLERIAENELALLDRYNIRYTSYESNEYPAFMKSIPIPPLFLSWKGNFEKAVMEKASLLLVVE